MCFLLSLIQILLVVSLVFAAVLATKQIWGGSITFVAISILFFWLIGVVETQIDGIKQKEKEKNLHSNFLLLPEGRYILDHIVSTDSAKVRFVLQLPGIAERRVEVIAYDNSPTYWNEWQAEETVSGDTLIIQDVWVNGDTGKKYERTVQKLSPNHIGLGYISHQWLERPNWQQ